jgi:hypothetical protein
VTKFVGDSAVRFRAPLQRFHQFMTLHHTHDFRRLQAERRALNCSLKQRTIGFHKGVNQLHVRAHLTVRLICLIRLALIVSVVELDMALPSLLVQQPCSRLARVDIFDLDLVDDHRTTTTVVVVVHTLVVWPVTDDASVKSTNTTVP